MKIIKKKSINLLIMMSLIIAFVVPNISYAYTILGNQDKPTLTIHKFEQDPATITPGQGEEGTGLPNQSASGDPLPGVEFTLTQTHEYDPETDEWTEVNGTPFTRVTDENGLIVIEDIGLGRYSVKETDGPPHVNLNPDEFFVDIPMTNTDGDTLNYDVHIYPKNETIRGAVELFKIDGEQAGEVGLADVVFELYNADDILIETLTTDTDGYIRVDALPYGDYYFKEIDAPGDYVVFGSEIPFSITQSGTISATGDKTGTVEEISITNYEAPSIEKTVNNTNSIEINRETEFTYNLKIKLPDDIATYEEFIISDTLDDRLAFTDSWSVEGADVSIFDFDVQGQTLTWTVNNFNALDGVEFIIINFTAEIKEGAVAFDPIENNANIDFTNESGTNGKKTPIPAIVIPVEGSLKIVKQDGSTSETLQEAIFELRNKETDETFTKTTDLNGEIIWEGLDYGEYELVETKAPEGYRLLTKPIDITIDGDNNDITITIDNFKSGWELPQTGGIGTTLFTIIGLSLMAIATLLYIRKRKILI